MTNLPCKPFFAILKCFQKVTWETILSINRSLPLIAIDYDAILKKEVSSRESLPQNLGDSLNFPIEYVEVATSSHR